MVDLDKVYLTRVVLGDNEYMPDDELLRMSCMVCSVKFNKGDTVVLGPLNSQMRREFVCHDSCFTPSKYGPVS